MEPIPFGSACHFEGGAPAAPSAIRRRRFRSASTYAFDRRPSYAARQQIAPCPSALAEAELVAVRSEGDRDIPPHASGAVYL
jgi:hypothetical protein